MIEASSGGPRGVSASSGGDQRNCWVAPLTWTARRRGPSGTGTGGPVKVKTWLSAILAGSGARIHVSQAEAAINQLDTLYVTQAAEVSGVGDVVCDQDARVLAAGRGVFELTGFQEGELMGQDVGEALSLSDQAPIGVVQEWGVRQLGLHLELAELLVIDVRDRAVPDHLAEPQHRLHLAALLAFAIESRRDRLGKQAGAARGNRDWRLRQPAIVKQDDLGLGGGMHER